MKKEKIVLKKNELKNLCCNFCGKKQSEIKILIAGPGCYICNECINTCNEVVEENRQMKLVQEDQKNLVKEIAELVIEYIDYLKDFKKKNGNSSNKKTSTKRKTTSKNKTNKTNKVKKTE